ncbi:MAG TPA: hypothetical protein VHD87_15565 [Acidimicrobiales bacterium]|nr:hypothetical protein [Acidimicrobiales bacterium]
MTAELHDLGLRLRAATDNSLVARLANRSVPLAMSVVPNGGTVALVVEPAGPRAIRVEARRCDGDTVWRGVGPDALGAIADAVGDTTIPTRLIVGKRRDLRLLAACARATPAEHPHAAIAAVVMWWVDRADHPDTNAVTVAVDDCAQRWVSADPDAERTTLGWARLFGHDTTDQLDALVFIALRLAADKSAPTINGDTGDRVAFSQRGSWRIPHNPRTAALRLRHRCDAADHFANVLLADPLWQRRAAWNGEVVACTIPAGRATTDVIVQAELPICRFRAGENVVVEVDNASLSASIREVYVDDSGNTMLHIDLNTYAHHGPAIVRPMPYDAKGRAIKNLADRYGLASWAVRKAEAAPLARRPVPLDVVVAAADL